jgi:integrase
MTGKRRARANGEGSIFPYRNGYAAYVWVTTPEGKSKRKYVYGKTRDIVHDKWVKLHSQAKQGAVATSTPTLGAFLLRWLEDVVRPNLAPLTYATYEGHVRLYIVPGLGAKQLDKLRVADVQTWLNKVGKQCQCCAQGKDERRPKARQRCCAVGDCCGQTPSTRTVKDLRAVLRSALTQAVSEELVTKNVATFAKVPKVRRTRKPRRWTTEQASVFLESSRAAGDRLYAAYVLLVVLGLRKGEVLGLLDVGSEVVSLDELAIEWQLQRVRGELLHREVKTDDSEATLPLPAICTAAIEVRRAQRRTERHQAGAVWQESGLFFTGRYGTPVEPRTFDRAFALRARKAGVPCISPHDARRTCAGLLVDLDVHPRVVMQILRHANFDVTMEIYAKASSAKTREALERLGASLAG